MPSAPGVSLSGFNTDRFNQVLDTYDVIGTISVGGYTLISASLFEGSTLIANTGTGASLSSYNRSTLGNQVYKLEVTASSPLDGTINRQSTTVNGTLSKTDPAVPTISATATVQLDAVSSQIEQGATGSITFTSASGASIGWSFVFMTSSVASPIYVTGSATGSTSITINASAFYSSSGVNGSDNSPALTKAKTSVNTTYTKIRSVRAGASTKTSFTLAELEDISSWDTRLGGTIGLISKGTTTASGASVTITWSGDKYHYIVYDSAKANLTNITTSGFGVFGTFTLLGTVGSYKVYRSGLQSGGAGTTITYVLT